MRVDELGSAQLKPFIATIDQVFLAARGRTGSVGARWPALFQPGGARCFAIWAEGVPVSGLVARPVDCMAGGHAFAAHQVGFVFTLPAWRGRGLAPLVLKAVAAQVAGPLVLWTGRPEFYARYGWEAWDHNGAKAEWRGDCGSGDEAVALTPDMVPHLAAIRAGALPCRVTRTDQDWLVRPFGTECMLVVATRYAYALFSRRDDHAILYEMVGDPTQFGALWASVVRGCRSALANLDATAPAAHWLRTQGVAVQPNPLAMWLRWPLSERWSLDWLDRI